MNKNTNRFDLVVSGFLGHLEQSRFSGKTVDCRRNSLRVFVKFLQKRGICRFQDVDLETIERFQTDLKQQKLKSATIDTYLRSIKTLYRFMEKEGLVFLDPTIDMVLPRPEAGTEFIPSVEEMNTIIVTLDVSKPSGKRDRAFFETAYGTGARKSELLMMDTRDLDLREGTVRIKGKGAKERIVPLGRQAVKWIGIYLNEARGKIVNRGKLDQNALWINQNGDRFSFVGLQAMTRTLAMKSGVPFTLHSIRRACATHMLNNGAHPEAIRMLLGHADLATLGRYLRVSLTDLRKTHGKTKVGA